MLCAREFLANIINDWNRKLLFEANNNRKTIANVLQQLFRRSSDCLWCWNTIRRVNYRQLTIRCLEWYKIEESIFCIKLQLTRAVGVERVMTCCNIVSCPMRREFNLGDIVKHMSYSIWIPFQVVMMAFSDNITGSRKKPSIHIWIDRRRFINNVEKSQTFCQRVWRHNYIV